MSTTATVTPAMRQYLEAKRQYRDAIVFFRMGDFYEMFYEDALVASRALELTLTSRSKDAGGNGIPMCGVPYHAAGGYVAKLVRKEMRPSGAFIKYSRQSDTEMLISAWRDDAKGMNRLLTVYGLGQNPFYKDIDRVSFDVSSEEYRKMLKNKLAEIQLSKDPLFFEPTLAFTLKLLEANRRDEAGRYEPLEEGENKAAVQNLRNIRWNDYQYSFILVLGSGPANLSTRVSRIGAKRADQGAQLFLDRKAPLIILSGGHVHPMQTPFNEAIEMKKYLMEKFQIPAERILVDPYARHTTTNFRNAARLAFRYGLPSDRSALVTSSEDHIAIVTREGFRIRCSTELGYFPLESVHRISPIVAEFKPSPTSLFFDANDPLDP